MYHNGRGYHWREETRVSVIEEVKSILADVLQLGERAVGLTADSNLLGAMPEFDSMAVISIITALEDRYEFMVADDEIDAAVFETVGALAEFVQLKVAQQ
ncbi:MAG: acyl carrier protein [Gammaproteobacteria bacterium]|nr:acyl carrier protein [Gammaproteobacteria bacterium]